MKPLAFATVLTLLTSTALHASEPAAAGQPLAVAMKKSVQDALKLTPQQVEAIKKLFDQASKNDKFAAAVALAKELKPDQVQRLKEISYQVRGGSVLADPEVIKQLSLSLTQKRKIGEIWKNEEENLRQILRVTRFRNEAARRKFILDHRRGAGKKMLEFLTEEQTAKLKKMQGAPIDLKDLDS